MNALNTQNIARFSAFLSSLPYRKITLFMALFGILARIYQYIFHKDLWLDEAMLAFSMIGIDFKDIFFAPLPFTQAAPLGFLAVSKLIGSLFCYNEYGLYLFPLICGIGTIICAYKIGKILFSDFGQCVFMTLCVGSLSLLHYTTEFKQYGIEAFASFLLIYCYLKNVHFRTFSIVSMILILFSNTIIFISIALMGGGIYKNRANLATFVKRNFLYVAMIFGFFALYYVLYIRFQAVEGFYTYWESFFLPHNLAYYPSFIKNTLLGIYVGFSPFGKAFVIPLYMLVSCVGLYRAFVVKRDVFVVLCVNLIIYIALSLCRIYPFGHEGIIGGRLSLFMSPIFFLCFAYGFYVPNTLKSTMQNIAKILLCMVLCGLIVATLLRYGKTLIKQDYHIQQTHALITKMLDSASSRIYIYKASKPAFLYYAFLDSNQIKQDSSFVVFDENLQALTNKLKNEAQDSHIFILASHYPSPSWENELESSIKNLYPNATIHKAKSGWGSISIEINTQESSPNN